MAGSVQLLRCHKQYIGTNTLKGFVRSQWALVQQSARACNSFHGHLQTEYSISIGRMAVMLLEVQPSQAPVVGSSAKMMEGFAIKAHAIDSLRFSPPAWGSWRSATSLPSLEGGTVKSASSHGMLSRKIWVLQMQRPSYNGRLSLNLTVQGAMLPHLTVLAQKCPQVACLQPESSEHNMTH